MSDIALTSSQRTSLISLQNTQKLSSRTQTRLSTGREINTVVDDAVNFFKAKSLTDRAADFDLKKADIDQGISALNATLTAIESIDALVKQLKGINSAAVSQSTAERQQSTSSFELVVQQISELVEDASYQGLNLLSSTNSTLTVSFGTRDASKIEIGGLDLNATVAGTSTTLFSAVVFSTSSVNASLFGLSGGSFTSFGVNNSYATSLAANVESFLDNGVQRLRGHASTLGSNVAILQTRLDFTNNYVNELNVGSDKLTLADLNEEGANLVALQTRQQLGIQALSVSGQQQQAVLSLIG